MENIVAKIKNIFKKKETITEIDNIADYSNKAKEYNARIKEYETLKEEFNHIFNDCAKDNMPYDEMMAKTTSIQNKIYFLDKEIRQIREPEITYGKKWNGVTILLEDFIKAVQDKELTDNDGYGEYATPTSKSDIKIYPSDILENIYRTDFSHIIWFSY